MLEQVVLTRQMNNLPRHPLCKKKGKGVKFSKCTDYPDGIHLIAFIFEITYRINNIYLTVNMVTIQS